MGGRDYAHRLEDKGVVLDSVGGALSSLHQLGLLLGRQRGSNLTPQDRLADPVLGSRAGVKTERLLQVTG